jgi:mono/diheme cytochrome c family protein
MKMFALAAVIVLTQGRTTQDGLYTAAQATRGEATYSRACASCHAPDLTGDGQASPLAGKEFTTAWTDQSLGDLFERIRATMPADAPGTLKRAEVADLIAFILQKNAFAEGQNELPADEKALKAVKFVPRTP